jgi:inward rectifier potassium channel
MADPEIRKPLSAIRRLAIGGSQRPPRSQVRAIGGRRIIADGLDRGLWKDFYHNAMVASWPRFFAALAAAFVSLNLFFALIYSFGHAPIANAHEGSFADLFFFSVETTATVGYGDMYPQTLYGHIVATSENFVGLSLLAVMGGLVFSRFSRPRAQLMFARNPVLAPHDGVPTLTFRIANERSSFITEATAKLWMLGPAQSAEGRRFIAFQPMRLSKNENPMLALSWTLFHPIDADSPLYGMSETELVGSEMNFVLSINGLDETSSQTVHARETFAAQDVRHGHEFVDIFSIDESGLRHIDYARLHDTRPIAPTAPAESFRDIKTLS